MLGRPISPKVDNEKLLSYIYETERLNIKPLLGDRLFAKVMHDSQNINAIPENSPVRTLIEGGEYVDKRGQLHLISGIKVAIAYFVYAQYIIDGDFQLTRAGVVVKDNAYSSHVSSKERSDCYNNALTAANGFMKEVKTYLRHAFPGYHLGGAGVLPTDSIRIRRIG